MSAPSSESIISKYLATSTAENIFKKFLRLSSSSSEIILADVPNSILSKIYFESLESNS